MITESRPTQVLAALHTSADPEREYLFASRDAGPDDLILVAWAGAEAVGYIATSEDPSTGLLVWEHVVVPAHRNRGIGHQLLLEAVRRIEPGAVVEIDPMAELDADRASDYYGRLGFRRRVAGSDRLASGVLSATAAEVLRAAVAHHGTGGEAGTPVSVITDAKATGVVTVEPAEPVRTVISTLHREQIGAVVVSTDGRRVEGIFSERDVVVGLDGRGPAFLDAPVGEVCTTDVVTCVAHDPVVEAMERMTRRRVRHLPVISAGRLVGIVSTDDLVFRRLPVLGAGNGTDRPATSRSSP
jgi:CBS domain-containing protein/GNAT superfamily N-acetyltransferase